MKIETPNQMFLAVYCVLPSGERDAFLAALDKVSGVAAKVAFAAQSAGSALASNYTAVTIARVSEIKTFAHNW